MKRFLAFLLLSILISNNVMAQVRTRKMPFLPYAGVATEEKDRLAKRSIGSAPTVPAHKTIFFDVDSSALRPDQAKNLIQVGKWLEKEGGAYYYVHIFTSPNISNDLAKRRGDTVIQALSDFKVGEPIIQPEYRKSPVVNPNRVEIYLNSVDGSLGTASTKHGAGSVGNASSNLSNH